MVAHMHNVLGEQFEQAGSGGPGAGERAPELDDWRALAVLSPRPW